MKHDLSKQPKWVQKIVKDLKFENKFISQNLETLEQAHYVLNNKDFFIIENKRENRDYLHLCILEHDHPFPVCCIGKNGRSYS